MNVIPIRQKIRFFGSAVLIYSIVVFGLGYLILPNTSLQYSRSVALKVVTSHTIGIKTGNAVISGRPIRLVIPGSGIDIPINPGYYDQTTNTWTLSGYDAQYAEISVPANTSGGETFIYGHNNDFVFGSLRHNTPQTGAIALLYTDTGHTFMYTFQTETNLAPTDTEVLHYDGPPILMIQTCTGSLDEWRSEYIFEFVKVD